jgi:hypothetical protein
MPALFDSISHDFVGLFRLLMKFLYTERKIQFLGPILPSLVFNSIVGIVCTMFLRICKHFGELENEGKWDWFLRIEKWGNETNFLKNVRPVNFKTCKYLVLSRHGRQMINVCCGT